MNITLSEDKTQVIFDLPTLKGFIPLTVLGSLEKTPVEKFLSLKSCENSQEAGICEDPRQLGRDYIATVGYLQHINRRIISEASKLNTHKTSNLSKWSIESLLVAFSLASIFQLYFNRYELHQAIWECNEAWMHLLHLRYHTTIRLYERKNDKLLQDQGTYLDLNLATALRDWYSFCTDPDNHFLLRKESYRNPQVLDVIGVEGEVALITRPARTAPPYAFYLSDKKGKRRLDRLIAEWYLRDRYSWFGATRLILHRMGVWKWGILALFVLSAFVIASVPAADYHWMPSLLIGIYFFAFVFLVWGAVWRPIMDILLPRAWMATAVGYLPFFLVADVWKLGINQQLSSIVGLNVVALFLAWFYFRWEVGNHLSRTPGLNAEVPIRRAAWLAVWGWLVAVILGFILFDVAGTPMANVIWSGEKSLFRVNQPLQTDLDTGNLPKDLRQQFEKFGIILPQDLSVQMNEKGIKWIVTSNSMEQGRYIIKKEQDIFYVYSKNTPPTSTPGLIGGVHLKVLFFFAPLALLTGVIVQIFWEDKPITEPL